MYVQLIDGCYNLLPIIWELNVILICFRCTLRFFCWSKKNVMPFESKLSPRCKSGYLCYVWSVGAIPRASQWHLRRAIHSKLLLVSIRRLSRDSECGHRSRHIYKHIPFALNFRDYVIISIFTLNWRSFQTAKHYYLICVDGAQKQNKSTILVDLERGRRKHPHFGRFQSTAEKKLTTSQMKSI